MVLLIVRHAIAFERDRHRWRDDGARPLSPAVLGKDRGKLVAVVGHQPGLGALLTACPLGNGKSPCIDLKKNAVACVSFEGSARAGHAALEWLATPSMLRGFRHD